LQAHDDPAGVADDPGGHVRCPPRAVNATFSKPHSPSSGGHLRYNGSAPQGAHKKPRLISGQCSLLSGVRSDRG
jgi:hypothetical protein